MADSHGTAAAPVGFGGASAVFAGMAEAAGLSGEDCTLPGIGSPAAGWGSPLGGGVGDLVSSGIATEGANLRRRGRLEER